MIKFIGGLLVAIPLAIIIIGVVISVGIGKAALIFGVALTLTAMLVGGMFLLTKS